MQRPISLTRSLYRQSKGRQDIIQAHAAPSYGLTAAVASLADPAFLSCCQGRALELPVSLMLEWRSLSEANSTRCSSLLEVLACSDLSPV